MIAQRPDLRSLLRPVVRKVRGQDLYAGLDPGRKELVDVALGRLGSRSFADLGGVWGVDGGYTFYALERYRPERAVLVDATVTPWVGERARRFRRLELVEGNFGSPDVAARVGTVDAIFLFDTLLHQVAPDWDAVLELYAPRARAIVVYNPQWTGGETVRLLDLGPEEYFRNVPHDPHDPTPLGPDGRPLYARLFERLDEIHPVHGKPWRDVHSIWQWGIADADLVGTMSRLGFSLELERSYGRFKALERFERRGFVFVR